MRRSDLHQPDLSGWMRSTARQAPVTSGLIATNLVVFLAMLAFGAGLWGSASSVQLAWGANFGPATQDGQWWRIVTAMFLHFGAIHLLVNMWALWDIGRLVERVYGRMRFFAVYLGAGALGNLVSLAVHGNTAISGGASGAIFGLYGALIVFLWRERRQIAHTEFRWLLGASLFFILLMLGLGSVVTGIDNAAHGGGLVAGALVGTVLVRPWLADSPRKKRSAWWALAVLVVAPFALAWWTPPPRYLSGEETQAREAIDNFLREEQNINRRWDDLLASGKKGELSFDQLAGNIDAHIVTAYQRSFEQLSAVNPASPVPSKNTLLELQHYANLRSDAARALADGLRAHDAQTIRRAMEQAQSAAVQAQTPPAASPSPGNERRDQSRPQSGKGL